MKKLFPIAELKTTLGSLKYVSLRVVGETCEADMARLPYTIRILIEGMARRCDGKKVTQETVRALCHWQPEAENQPAIAFFPGRVLLQDFTGVPLVNDLTAMRAALARLGVPAQRVNPLKPVDLVIDHSVQVDCHTSAKALEKNVALEYSRNHERYAFLKWSGKAFQNLRIIPPGAGICHQINLEYLAQVVLTETDGDGERWATMDTLVGADSHTTMVNGLGVLGWGVGGIEATVAMLDEPLDMLAPQVIGFRLLGALPEGVTPTDAALTIIQTLRKKGVVEKFVEFTGEGAAQLSVADRAIIANMAPESGATCCYFPVDVQTLAYLRLSGRSPEQVALVEAYTREQSLFRQPGDAEPEYSEVIELDLTTIEPSLAGPKRPQDRAGVNEVKTIFQQALVKPKKERGYGLDEKEVNKRVKVELEDGVVELGHGSVLLAAITSCTNTSNPYGMIAAGLLARNAVARGLNVPHFVKTSLSPGSRVVTAYLQKAGLLKPLAELGFHLVGYGCMTCIGNSGPLPPQLAFAIRREKLIAAAVISGNRNFEGRIHSLIQANFLASPPLVVAYALAGSISKDFSTEPLGLDGEGVPVTLQEIMPTREEVEAFIASTIQPEMFVEAYEQALQGDDAWRSIKVREDLIYNWAKNSTYIQEPPYFIDISPVIKPPQDVSGGRILAIFGDSITTDHISPAGTITSDSAAGQYLQSHRVAQPDFNAYGTRRGNDRVMVRGAFSNPRIKNLMVFEEAGEGSFTRHYPDGEVLSIFDAAKRYRQEGIPMVVIAGKEYGSGSSRDWAAKAPALLGVRAIIAESFERIHRSNLIGMGILPLQFLEGESAVSLGLSGDERLDLLKVQEIQQTLPQITVKATRPDGSEFSFETLCRIQTAREVAYFRHGGILNKLLRDFLARE